MTLVKCDVEDHELAVLKGASQFFERVKPAMMIEATGTAEMQDAANNEFHAMVKGYGYVPYWFDGKNPRNRVKMPWGVNYFFSHAAHLPQRDYLIAE